MENDVKSHQRLTDLEQENARLKAELARLNALVKLFQEQSRLNRHQNFSPSSEKHMPGQQDFFNEVEAMSDAAPAPEEPTIEVVTHQRRRKTKEEKFQALVTEVQEHELSEADLSCPVCDKLMRDIGVQERYEVNIIPAQVEVILHREHHYACGRCEKAGEATPFKTAAAPKPFLPKSVASPSLLAYLIDQKYNVQVPIYRVEKQLADQMDLRLPRQTLYHWLIQTQKEYLGPVISHLHQALLNAPQLHADETPVQVLKEAGRKASQKSYMWLLQTGRGAPPIALYYYQEKRDAAAIRQLLQGYSGSLQVDGYAAYESLQPQVRLVGCWAHARRAFVEVLKSLPPGVEVKGSLAQQALTRMAQLYEIERRLKASGEKAEDEVSRARILEQRQHRSLPVVDQFFAELKAARACASGRLLKAIQYALNQERKLRAYLTNPYAEIDNNRAERSIKPFVIGRKNFLFCDTPSGAHASAAYYSLVITAKLNGLKVFAYLDYLLSALAALGTPTAHQLEALMPWSDALPETLRSTCRQ